MECEERSWWRTSEAELSEAKILGVSGRWREVKAREPQKETGEGNKGVGLRSPDVSAQNNQEP